METVLILLTVQGVLGAVDTVWNRECWRTSPLPGQTDAVRAVGRTSSGG